MPRRSILSVAERESLFALSDAKDEMIRHYTFSGSDLSVIGQRRGAANRLGFAMQLCYLRFPGIVLGVDQQPSPSLLRMVSDQLRIAPERWADSGLKITPLDAAVPDAAQGLIDQAATLLPHVKITELLLEVDLWTDFTRHFTHLKSGGLAADKHLLLTAILANAINLGLTKMAESCPGATYARLSWLQAWHIRDESYSAALSELVNAQFRRGFAEHWGDGTTSSSDGRRFKTSSKAESTGHVNPKYGSEPGRMFYTHVSDQYAPFHTKVVNVGIRDSTYSMFLRRELPFKRSGP